MFKLALLLHIIGILGLFAAMTLQIAGLLILRRARTIDQISSAGMLLSQLRIIFGSAGILIFISGVYMTIIRINHHQSFGWVIVAFVAYLIISVLSARAGESFGRAMQKSLAASKGKVTKDLQELARADAMTNGTVRGVFLALGIVVLMIYKPLVWVSILILLIALAIGHLSAAQLNRRIAKV